jgi:hypothetical protein
MTKITADHLARGAFIYVRHRQIARLLNRAGKPTGRGNGWTQARVRSFRSHYGIAVHRPDEWAERGEIALQTAAQIMDVSVMTALRMVRQGVVKGRQICRGAPWAELRRHFLADLDLTSEIWRGMGTAPLARGDIVRYQ